ncbi:S8 family serine peptidase [uncultured Clostridium sp.]|uniref:S8 family peptidase n=1 Tax=uncultured Clostridium sp. TaxID=59620 RepID=UPI0028E47271|nr:S8 family serine peptidase [uncultured Clostridium sp.]
MKTTNICMCVIGLCLSLFIISRPVFAFESQKVTTSQAVTMYNEDIDLVILFKDGSINKAVEKIVTNSGGKIINEFSDLGGIEVKCPINLIATIKSENSVQSLAPNHEIKLSSNEITTEAFTESAEDSSNISDDLYEKYQWDIKRVTNNGESFNLNSGNHSVIVGIIDSGIDTIHPDLVNNFLGGKNLVPANFEDDSSEIGDPEDVTDRIGHGTSVAGEIAGNGRIKGVAPNIGFKSYRVFNQKGDTTATICASAIIDATNDGVKVINLSLGSYDLKGKCYWTDSTTGIKYYLGSDMAEYSLLKRAIKYAVSNGVTVVVAAGNEKQNCSDKKNLTNYLNNKYSSDGFIYDGLTYESPGTIKGVITVSATGKDDNLASYSNYGDDFIDISAPGGDTSVTKDKSNLCFTAYKNSQYTYQQGTSFSAPKVSAAAALIICKNNKLTPKEVAKKIYKTADKLDSDKHAEYYGAGMLNAYNAVK